MVLGSGGVPHSRYVRQLLSSVKSMWEMKLPPEFVSEAVYIILMYQSVIQLITASLFIQLATCISIMNFYTCVYAGNF